MREDIIVGIDSRPAERGGDQVVRKLSDIKKGADSAGSSLDKLARGDGLARLGRSAGDTTRQMAFLRNDIAQTQRATQGLNTATLAMGGTVQRVTGLWRTFSGALAGLGVLAVVREFVQATDAMKRMEAQIRLTLAPTTSFAKAWGDVQRVAANTRLGLEETVDLYGRIARQAHTLGITSGQAAQMTENFAKTLKISGATAMETAAVMRQFSQAIARGTLRGDEFISMMEGNPRAIQLFADSLGIGTGKLIEMAKEGQITGETLKKALLDPKLSAQLAAEFEQIPVTFGDAMTQIRNAATVAFGEFDQGGQFSRTIIDFIGNGVDGFADLGDAAEEFGMDVHSVFAGFAGIWDGFYEAGLAVIEHLKEQARSLGLELDGALDADPGRAFFRDIDTVGNAVVWGVNQTRAWGGQDPFPYMNLEERFVGGRDTARRNLEADKRERDWQAWLPAGMRWTNPEGMKRYLQTGNSLVERPKDTPGADGDSDKAPTWDTSSISRLLKDKWGGTITSTTGGKHVAGSLHYSGNAVDWVPAGGMGNAPSKEAVREYLISKGVNPIELLGPGDKDHDDHFHVGFAKKGLKGDAIASALARANKDAASEAERLAEQLAKATENVRKYQQGLTDSNTLLTKQNELWAQHLLGSKTALEDLSKINREHEENNAVLENRQRWGDAWAQLTEAEKANQDAIARSIARQRMDAETMAGITARRGAEVEQQKRQQAEISALAAGDWRIAREIGEAERVRLAQENERAELLRTNADLSSEVARDAIAAAGAAEREAIARERIASALATYNADMATASPLGARIANQEQFERKMEQYVLAYTTRLHKALEKGDMERYERERQLFSDVVADARAEYFKANAEIANQFRDAMLQSVASLADALARLIGGKSGQKIGGIVGGIGSVVALFDSFRNFGSKDTPWSTYRAPAGASPVADVLGSSNDMLQMLFPTATAPGGKLHGVSGILGKASMGAAVGASIAPLGHAVFGQKNYSSTGSQIGGGIGMIAGTAIGGPIGGMIGSVIGSVLGGIVGGLFKEKNKGAIATINNAYDTPDVTGKSRGGPMDTAATSLAEAVQGALVQIAGALDATLTDFKVTIGVMNEKFVAGGKSFATEKEAVMHAIKLAIQQGAIQGLSAASNRVLQQSNDPLAILDTVAAYEQLEMQLLKLTDPIKGAFQEMVDGFVELYTAMLKAGYTVEELAVLEEAYAEQRKQMLEAMKQPYIDFINQITQGPDSGLSVQGQYQAALSELSKMEKSLKAGTPVDQDEFLRVSNTVIGLAGQLYGTSTAEYAAIRDRLVRLSELAMAQVDQLAPEETLAAEIAKAGGETVTAIGTTNELLTQIRDILSGKTGTGTGTGVPATGTPSFSGGSSGGDSFVGGGSGGISGESQVKHV